MVCARTRAIPPQRAAPINRRRESITNVRATIIFSVCLSISFELLLPKTCMKKTCMNRMVTASAEPADGNLAVGSMESDSAGHPELTRGKTEELTTRAGEAS